MKGIKQILTALILTVATQTPAKAVEGFQAWEHPFQQVQAGLDQWQGNTMCWQIFSDLGKTGGSGEFQVGFPDSHVRVSVIDKYSWDGTLINNPNHVWYHQQRGICVANTNGW